MADAFFVPDGERFVPTELTRGPWSPDAQHAGPPAALVARAMERIDPPELRMARFTLEVLRPIPLTPLRVEARPVRPGKRVQYVEAVLRDDDGEVARASAWRIRPAQQRMKEVELEPTPLPGPEAADRDQPAWTPPWGESYFTGMEWRPAGGSLTDPGPAAVWMRMRYPLVPGEEPSPLTRVLVVADSGNGISWVTPLEEYLFINTELTVHLARMPEGEWVCLDARTRIGPEGVGIAESVLWDERGRIGAGSQSLLVGRR